MGSKGAWLGMAIVFAGYTLVYTGYVWLRGYDIPLRQIVGPVNYYQGKWPPKKIPPTQIFPASSKTPGA